ncbi:MAG: type II CAAX endopeptidase family protein [Chloroflexota bacterium]
MKDTHNPKAEQAHRRISLILLTGLLFLRLPMLAGVTYLSKTPPEWLFPIFEVTTYLLTALLLWWERDRLSYFHIDKLALTIIILFKPIATVMLAIGGSDGNVLAFPKMPSLAIWAIAVALAIAFKASRLKLPVIRAADIKWFGAGAFAGMVLAILLAYPSSMQIDRSDLNARPELLSTFFMVMWNFVYQLGYAAVTEEPLFRGFLWGHLRGFGWKEIWIWLFQAGLFMLSHIYYLNKAPISFWLIVPMGALVVGFMAWRSRSIATSMATHGAVNALGYAAGYIVAFYRF